MTLDKLSSPKGLVSIVLVQGVCLVTKVSVSKRETSLFMGERMGMWLLSAFSSVYSEFFV